MIKNKLKNWWGQSRRTIGDNNRERQPFDPPCCSELTWLNFRIAGVFLLILRKREMENNFPLLISVTDSRRFLFAIGMIKEKHSSFCVLKCFGEDHSLLTDRENETGVILKHNERENQIWDKASAIKGGRGKYFPAAKFTDFHQEASLFPYMIRLEGIGIFPRIHVKTWEERKRNEEGILISWLSNQIWWAINADERIAIH